VAITYFGTISR